ncbi:MAG: FkbM family methyltransferase [Gemmatimonadetes bacterium]|nr:FkbM family methyltransferase [Gemmatimonadota bacterium]
MPVPLELRRRLAPLVLPVRVRIRSGPNEGCWWSLASGRYLKGNIEQARMRLLEHLLHEGDACWDVGAHHGYVALHASRCVGSTGTVHAFEPSPYNLIYLRKHLDWNARDNVHLMPLAVSAEDGTARLEESGSSRAFTLAASGVEVETASVPSLLGARELPSPDVLKVDVEGAEADVVEAAAHHLGSACVALVAIHSMANYTRVTAAFREAGFTVHDSAGTRRLREVETREWGEDPDVLAVGPDAEEPGREILEILDQL